MNFFDEMEGFRGFRALADHKTGTLSTLAVTVSLTTPGLWKLTATQNFHWAEVAAGGAVTVSTGTFEHGGDSAFLFMRHGETVRYVSFIRQLNGTSGKLYADRIKGA